jgi:hypothetical protein
MEIFSVFYWKNTHFKYFTNMYVQLFSSLSVQVQSIKTVRPQLAVNFSYTDTI